MYLSQEHDLKFHKLRAVFSLMPPIERLEKAINGLLFTGFILLTAGLGRATRILMFCLSGIELFGMTFLLIPYYTGLIAHLPNGNLKALSIGQLGNGGIATMLARLTVNKPQFRTAPVMAILWILYVAATLSLHRQPWGGHSWLQPPFRRRWRMIAKWRVPPPKDVLY